MLPNDRAQPAAPAVPGRLARVLSAFRRAPLPLKIGLIVLAIILSGPEIGIVIPAIRARLAVRHEWDLATTSRPKGQILVAGLSLVAWRPR